MIQIGLGADGEPEVLAYAQHDSGEARAAGDVEWVEREGGRHPVVYVSPLSHASYFEAGTHPYPVGIDHPYGDGPEAWLPVARFGDWVYWPGRWGNSERVIARRIGNGPPSPVAPELEVEEPGRLPAQDGPAQVPRRPRPAALPARQAVLSEPTRAQRARSTGARCIVDYRLREHPPAPLAPPVPDRPRRRAGDREPGGALRGRVGTEILRLPHGRRRSRCCGQHLEPGATAQRPGGGRAAMIVDLHAHYAMHLLPQSARAPRSTCSRPRTGRDRLRDRIRARLIGFASRIANYRSFESGPRVTVAPASAGPGRRRALGGLLVLRRARPRRSVRRAARRPTTCLA